MQFRRLLLLLLLLPDVRASEVCCRRLLDIKRLTPLRELGSAKAPATLRLSSTETPSRPSETLGPHAPICRVIPTGANTYLRPRPAQFGSKSYHEGRR